MDNKTDILQKRSTLTPAQRELLKRRMRGEAAKAAGKPNGIPRRPSGRTPLSFSQQRVWLLDQLEPGTATYNIPYAVQMKGDLHLDVLERALWEVISRHEVLRTVFSAGEEEAMQTVLSDLRLTIPLLDVTDLAAAELEAQIASESKRPFDLTSGPLLRATVLQHGADHYTLVLVMHHIIGDGWSFGVLIGEMVALYEAFLAGSPSPLPELPVQYGDFAHWQREWMQGEVLQKQLGYWQEQLGQGLTTLHLPTDRPRPAMQTFAGATYDFWVPKALEQRLEAFSKREDVTLYMTLLSAFKVLLYRYTMQEDISVGSPIANRNKAEIEGMIGFFVNTIVLRTGVSGDLSFRSLLSRVKQTAVGAFANQDLPFEKLVEHLQPERNMSFSPLFQVLFALQNAPVPELKLPGLQLQARELDSGTSKFDISLYVMQKEAGLLVKFEYNTDLFDRATIERMGAHFQNLLHSILSDADQPIATLSLLTEREIDLCAGAWNGPTADFPKDATVPELFAAQAARTPDAPALLFENESLSFREVEERANQVARFLQKQGVERETLVGISMERTPAMIIGLLGILKAGAAYVPIDPGYPEERKAYMLQDSAVRLLLTEASVLERLPVHDAQTICLDADWAEIAKESTAGLDVKSDAGSVMYVLYTSGSTGQPKGVEGTHRAMVNRFHWMWERYPFASGEVCAQKTSLNFGDSIWEIWGPLLQGVPLVIFSDLAVKDIEHFVPALRTQRVTRIVLVPSLLRALLDSYDDLQKELPDLNFWVCSGEALTVELTQRFQKAVPTALLLNLYGSTEVAADVTWYETEAVSHDAVNIPIGRPIANAELYILDRNMQQTAIGVPGELHAGGAVLARGYYQRPDLTAERFVPNPFGTGRLFKTGDIVRWLPDGNIEYLGRIDNQVKIRGFRIELGEIEAALVQHDGVHSTVVTAREDIPGEKRLVAYTVAHVGRELSAGDLRLFLLNKLPEYMAPSAFVMLDALPLTPSGKVNRQALPAPDRGQGLAEQTFVAPRTGVEAELAGIWQEVLRLERVSATANFFELGGHSLLATQILSRVRRAFDVQLPLKLFFETPTLHALAVQIEVAKRDTRGVQTRPVLPQPRTEQLPMSSSQERLWFFEQLSPGTPTYHIPEVVRIEGAIDLAALQAAFNDLISRHENLRTTFLMTEGKLVQKILPYQPRTLDLIDLQDLPESERFPHAQQRIAELYKRPFQLDVVPPFSLTLLRLSEADHILVLIMHHIITDGWSMSRIYQETLDLYDHHAHGKPSQLAELPVQYADFAVWQREWLQGELLQEQLTYWREQLAGSLPVLQLPTDRPRPAAQTFRGQSLAFEVPRTLSDDLHKLCQQEGVTLYMLLLAAFNTLLSRYSGQDDILLGSPVANRTREEVEGLIGFFVNTIVLRTDLSGNPTFRDLLARVKRTTLDAYANQDVPFERLVEEVRPERSTSHATLVQAVFALLNTPGSALQVEGLKVQLPGMMLTRLGVEKESIDYDFVVNMVDNENGLRGVFEYNADLFDRATIESMLAHFCSLLQSITENIDRQICDYNLISATAEEKIIVEWNQTEREVPEAELTLHEWFDRQADATPDAIALRYQEQCTTYGELQARSNQLAHHLQKLGVGPDVRVGICTERSLEMIVAVYGVLKAGGAYVPLDPDYPNDRLAFMIEDAQAAVLLTQSHLRERLAAHAGAANVIALDSEWDLVAAESAVAPAVQVTPDNLAYVIYTSGSTGRPKGAMLSHRSVVNNTRWLIDTNSLTEQDRFLLKTPFSFDVSVVELFAPLLIGGELVIAEPGRHTDAAYLLEVSQERQISFFITVPSQVKLLVDQAGFRNWSSLRNLLCGGEPLSYELCARITESLPSAQIYNMYGPTEACIFASYWRVELTADPQVIPIGRPLANNRLYILDRALRPVPVGVPGELYIGGVGLARGYLNREELTAKTFIESPYGRLYKTGDLTRWLPNGEIDFHGRIDHQVKLRGFRIETGEIEAVLQSHTEISDALVLLREDAPGDQRLVAYLIAAEEAPTVSELRALLKDKLPDYMVPSNFVFLRAFPLTPNQKIDRNALPVPERTTASERAYVAPRSETEQRLTEIWQQLLRTEGIGVHDNFFEIGGHSLLATHVHTAIQQSFGVVLPLKQLFEAVTIEEVAALIEQIRTADEQEFAQPKIAVRDRMASTKRTRK
ncbi:hypothetical protein CIG75_10465 [Tumebacillus algifaecis]|uniref:Carrier domain-containing protein n=1 Tax=Tumebacillus algifaecis TaxID=1214604 RepID=A0A223D1A8_9BACL|nr:non-ribosomal peptide synthetase [Tumebacillus algifaecis]ASS75372.1 hypothetical protein CIG75_10465 [Tumebacillus algifaecis]